MNENSFTDSKRFEELQVGRLLFPLTSEELVEFNELARLRPAEEHDRFAPVVASLDLLCSDMHPELLPEHLRLAVQGQAEQEMASKKAVSLAKPSNITTSKSRTSNGLPWMISAACLLLALTSWLFNPRPIQPETNLDRLRMELLASKEEIVQATWFDGTTPIPNAQGDIVWSPTKQQGYMKFRGLPVNEPTKEQYQLWIFDENQSDSTPIDGGVFDISSEEGVVVPINAKLHVQSAYMFAITIEKPGGVVVSSRERLPLLAKLE